MKKQPGVRVDKNGFTHVNMDEVLGTQNTSLPNNPTDAEELAAFHTPEQWPLRPPATPSPILPLKRPGKDEMGMPDCAVLVHSQGTYRFLQKNMFAVRVSDVLAADEVNPTDIFNAGWRGD